MTKKFRCETYIGMIKIYIYAHILACTFEYISSSGVINIVLNAM